MSFSVYAENGESLLDSRLFLAYTTESRDLNSHLMAAYKPSMSSRVLHHSNSHSSSGLYSDLKFRYIQAHQNNDFSSPKVQMELVGGVFSSLSSQLDINLELASGGWYSKDYGSVSFSKPKSFMGGVSGKPIWLQGAALSYALNDEVRLNVGKFSTSPLYRDGEYNILWDKRIAPEGIYGHFRRDLLNRYSLDVKLSAVFVDAISPLITGYGAAILPDLSRVSSSDHLEKEISKELINSSNRWMWAASANLLMQNTDYDVSLSAVYSSMSTKNMPVAGNGHTTNSVLSDMDKKTRRYKYNYSVLDLLMKMDLKLNFNLAQFKVNSPLSLSLQLFQNFGSDHKGSTSLDTLGFMGGGVVGKEQSKSLRFSYHYFRLPSDSTFSRYVDYDIGGTGYAGHRLAVKYFVNDDISVGLKYNLQGKQPPTSSDKSEIVHLAFADISFRL